VITDGVLEKSFSELAFVYDKPQCKAVLKQDFADFQVEEIIGFEFSGSGNHLCLQIRKINQTTIEVAQKIAKTFALKLSDVGYAGMKDKRGICTQWFSIPKNNRDKVDPARLLTENIEVLDVRDNDRKIRKGSHQENSFRIRLQKVQGAETDLQARVKKAGKFGVPNYFGPQRFGKSMRNVRRAIDYFAQEHNKPMRDRLQKSMMLSASRSFLFNQILSYRVENCSWAQILPGEILSLDGTSRFFIPGTNEKKGRGSVDTLPEQELNHEMELQARLVNLDIHPSGLLFGACKPTERYRVREAVESLESAVVSRYPELCQGLLGLKVASARRALRLVPRNIKTEIIGSGVVELEFTLTTGGYATTVLRELCMAEEPSVS